MANCQVITVSGQPARWRAGGFAAVIDDARQGRVADANLTERPSMPAASLRSRRDGGHQAAEGTAPNPPSSSGALAGLRARRACGTGSIALRSMVAEQLRPTLPKLAALLDESETEVLASMTFPPVVGQFEPLS